MSQIKYLKISNFGTIDRQAFSLLGASTKRNDQTKIGYFGSGLKYAVAFMLRENIEFRCFVGKNEVKFGVTGVQMRNQNFNRILVDGEPTSMTTEMGPNWEPWFAVRELYCNALDESIADREIVDEISPQDGYTEFYVSMADPRLREMMDNWSHYFSDKRMDMVESGDDWQIFSGGASTTIYRHGIRVHGATAPSCFHYNINSLSINESRVLDNPYSAFTIIARTLAKLSTPQVRALIKSIRNEKTFEFILPWDNVCSFTPSWLHAINERDVVAYEYAGYFEDDVRSRDVVVLPAALINSLKSQFGDQIHTLSDRVGDYDFTHVEATPAQKYVLHDIEKFFTEAGREIPYHLKVVKFHNNDAMAFSTRDTIFISCNAFDGGKRSLARHVTMEIERQKQQTGGSTALLNAMADRYLAVLEERTGIFL